MPWASWECRTELEWWSVGVAYRYSFKRELMVRMFVPLPGPTVGGYVTSLSSEQFASGVAAVMCLVAMVIVILTVPRSTKHWSRTIVDSKDSKVHGELEHRLYPESCEG